MQLGVYVFTTISVVSLSYLPSWARADDHDPVHTKVLILGAGLSGLTAAETLLENGVDDFIVLEGDSQVGGRLKSEDFHGIRINLGANWIHFIDKEPSENQNHDIWRLKEKHGLVGALSRFDDLTVFDESMSDVTEEAEAAEDRLETARDTLSDLYKSNRYKIDNCLKLMSIRSGLASSGWNPETPIEQVVEYWEYDAEFADPPDITSLDSILSLYDDALDDHFFVSDDRGFDFILREIENKTADKLKLNERVSKIEWNSTGMKDNVTVRTDNSTYIAEYVISTFGIGVLKKGDVEFVPKLPAWKRAEIQKFRMTWYTKIFLKFPDGDVLPDKFKTEWILFASSRRGYYPAFGNLGATGLLPDGKNVILAIVSGDESRRIEQQSDEVTKQEIMQILRTIDSSFPDVEDIYVTKWGLDPFQYGSYSDWPVDMTPNCFERLQAPVGGLYFAGEATHEKYNGYLQGAYYTGRDRATEVIACLATETPTDIVISDTPAPQISITCPLEYKPKYQIEGCTYEEARNYDPKATEDDGSCDFASATSVNLNARLLFLSFLYFLKAYH